MQNCKPFCILEKDKKTFGLITLYYNAMIDNKNLMAIDSIIQADEIKEHLSRIGKSEKDNEEISKWIERYSAELRSYLNSIKLITLFLYIDSKLNYRKELVQEVIENFIDIWDTEKAVVMDTIRMSGYRE